MAREVVGLLGIGFLATALACGGAATPPSLPPLAPGQTPRPPHLGPDPGPLIPGLGQSDWLSGFAHGEDYEIGSESDGATKTRFARVVLPQGEQLVRLIGPSWQEVAEVRATATASIGDADAFARDLFRTVAAVPYEGADPDAARRWVSGHVGAAASTVIAGMRFETSVDGPAIRTLRITPAAAGVPALADMADAKTSATPADSQADAARGPADAADGDVADAEALAALLSEAGPLDSIAAVGALIPRVNDFAMTHSKRPAGAAAKREAAALARLRLAYRSVEAGADPKLRLREVMEAFPGTAAARAAQARLSP